MEKLGLDEEDDNRRQVICISLESFYKDLSPADASLAQKGMFNFDHPGKIMYKEYNTILFYESNGLSIYP